MSYLKTSEAAALLNVSPTTLRSWERRFGYPASARSPGNHRRFTYREIAALRDGLRDGLSISSAVSRARQGALVEPPTALLGALGSYDAQRADEAMQAALAIGSLERAIHEAMLPALDRIIERWTLDHARWAFAARWAADWLRRAQRLAPALGYRSAIIVGDATRDDVDVDRVCLSVLELLCARDGFHALSLPVSCVDGIGDVVTTFPPRLAVIAGGHCSDDDVARWVYEVRRAAGTLPVALFRRGERPVRLRTTGTQRLAADPVRAFRDVLELLDPGGDHSPRPPARIAITVLGR